MYFPVARCDRMTISMQWLWHTHFNKDRQSHCLARCISQKTDYALKSSNYYLIQRFFPKKTDFVTQKTEFGHIFRLPHIRKLKTFDVVGLRTQSFLYICILLFVYYSEILYQQKIERVFPFEEEFFYNFRGKRHLVINFYQKTLFLQRHKF